MITMVVLHQERPRLRGGRHTTPVRPTKISDGKLLEKFRAWFIDRPGPFPTAMITTLGDKETVRGIIASRAELLGEPNKYSNIESRKSHLQKQ